MSLTGVDIKPPNQTDEGTKNARPEVLILSPYFPPSTLAGVHRARHLAKHLPAWGWWPTVVCVDQAFHEQRLDPLLARLVPASANLVNVAAIPASITRVLGVGEISLRAWMPMRNAVQRLLSTRRFGAVLITGSPFYPMLFAPWIRRRFGIPVVLDFQDPWVSGWGARQSALSKAGVSHWLARQLEPRALRGTAHVTSVSETQNDEMAARYPWFDRTSMTAIPIGGDPDDFATLRTRISSSTDAIIDPNLVNLSYVGTYLPRAEQLVRLLMRALSRLALAEPDSVRSLRLNFVGTSNQPAATTARPVQRIAEEEGVGHLVHEHPSRVPYLDALAVLARSDGLLMIGSDEPHYTASKIYPALMSGRPFLSFFHEKSSAHNILAAAGGGCAIAFRADSDPEAALAEGLRVLIRAPTSLGKASRAAYGPYEARVVAGRFAAIFDALTASRKLAAS
jgi:hypothetical protein